MYKNELSDKEQEADEILKRVQLDEEERLFTKIDEVCIKQGRLSAGALLDHSYISKNIIQKFLDDYYEKISKYALMYGGTLVGVESVWWTLMQFEAFLHKKQNENSFVTKAFQKVGAEKQCGCLGLSGKAKDWQELVSWLKIARTYMYDELEK